MTKEQEKIIAKLIVEDIKLKIDTLQYVNRYGILKDQYLIELIDKILVTL